MSNNYITIVTSYYPSKGAKDKNFVLPEILAMQAKGLSVKLLPLRLTAEIDNDLPDGLVVSRDISDEFLYRNIIFLLLSAVFSKFFLKELFSNFLFLISSYSRFVSFLKYSFKLVAVYRGLNKSKNDFIYTYWFSGEAVGAALYKEKYKSVYLQTRLHGYDLYEERDCNKSYMPYRDYVIRFFNRYIFLYTGALEYFRIKYPAASGEMLVSPLGGTSVEGASAKEFDQKNVTFFSCSYNSSVKRLSFIRDFVGAMAKLSPAVNILWVHYGVAKGEVDTSPLDKHLNVKCCFKGVQPPAVFIDNYLGTESAFFLNMSASEGQPVSIMEAMSCGIPVIATDVGGVKELVGDGGRVYDLSLSAADIARQASSDLFNQNAYALASREAISRQQKYYDVSKNHIRLAQLIKATSQSGP